ISDRLPISLARNCSKNSRSCIDRRTPVSSPNTHSYDAPVFRLPADLVWHHALRRDRRAGFTYQTHGAPLDPRSPPGSAYIVQRYSQGSRWSLAPNGLQNSFIGIKGTEPIGWNTSVVFALEASTLTR